MLRRWLTQLRLCFCSQTGEELRGHHLDRALDHALAHTGDGAAHLDVAGVVNFGEVTFLCEIEVAGTFQKTGRAFAFYHDAKVLRLSQILEPCGAVEYSFNRTDTRLDGRGKSVLTGSLQFLATRNTTLQYLGIDERLINALSSGIELMRTFQLHFTRAFAA